MIGVVVKQRSGENAINWGERFLGTDDRSRYETVFGQEYN